MEKVERSGAKNRSDSDTWPKPGTAEASNETPCSRRMAQLAGHDGDVFLHAEHIAKRQANELDIVFFHEPQQPVKRLFHSKDPLQNLKRALRPPW